ncbi:MAG: PAS domain S-box protein [Paracoccaceae bacterium]
MAKVTKKTAPARTRRSASVAVAPKPDTPLEKTAHAPPTGARDIPVVGVGVGAGGLTGLAAFFAAMPARTGIAFVVLQDSAAGDADLTPAALAEHTGLNVAMAREKSPLEPDHILLVPAGVGAGIRDGALRLTVPLAPSDLAAPIDGFFRSLARTHAQRAVAVLLSGAGSSGSVGLGALKEHGAMILVQDPDEAAHPQMPRHALATGLFDHVLDAAAMPAVIADYIAHPYIDARPDAPCPADAVAPVLPDILRALEICTTVNFGLYKQSMILRRVARRMALRQLEDPRAYLELLRSTPAEAKQLFRDLLISVTGFFRNPKVFRYLEESVIPDLVANCPEGQTLRFWVPGCATGEEAYSLAMLVIEACNRQGKEVDLQIFATDVDEAALGLARKGVYPAAIRADVSPERLERFFTRDRDHYVAGPELREGVVFAPQNILGDAPYSKIDLVSCRNLLIYIDFPTHDRVLRMLHYALNENGVLVLGPSETASHHADLFAPASVPHHVYRRIGGVAQPEVALARLGAPPDAAPHGGRLHKGQLAELSQTFLLERYAPAAVLINPQREVLFVQGPADRYVQVPQGEASRDLLAMARVGLRKALGDAVRSALSQKSDAFALGSVLQDGENLPVSIAVHPLGEEGALKLLVTFEERSDAPAVTVAPDGLKDTMAPGGLSADLGSDPFAPAMVRDAGFQAAAQALESSREEVQSLNEELVTLNAELQHKIDDERRLTDDLDSLKSAEQANRRAQLIAESIIHTVREPLLVLDGGLRIVKSSNSFNTIFGTQAGEIEGALLFEIQNGQWKDEALCNLLERVLPKQETVENFALSLRGADGTRRDMVLNARRIDRPGDGGEQILLAAEDVTEENRALRSLAEREARLMALLNTAPEAVILADARGRIESFSPAAEAIFGYSVDEVFGRNVKILMPEAERGKHDGYMKQYLRTGKKKIIGVGREVEAVRKDGTRVPVHLTLAEFRANGQRYFTGFLRDLTDEMHRRDAFQHAQKMEAVGQMTGGLAHDFNNLLTIIIGNLELLEMRVKDAGNLKLLSEVLGAAKMGADLTNQLLEFSRKQSVEGSEVDLNALICAMEPLLERTIDETIEIDLDLAEDLCPVVSDPSLVESAVLNLVLNARDAMPDGGHLSIETRNITLGKAFASTQTDLTPGPYVALRVRDTGTGMPADVIEHAFEPFYTTKGPGQGSGLGLSMVYGFAKQSRGHARIVSAPGDGTTVTLYLPVVPEEGVAEPAATPDRCPMGQGERVLVVDDDAAVRRLTVTRLGELGYRPVESEGGAQAIAMLRDDAAFDLVLSDVVMPGPLTGFDVAQQARAISPDLKILLVTGFEKGARRNPDSGGEAFRILRKPYGLNELAVTLRELLD